MKNVRDRKRRAMIRKENPRNIIGITSLTFAEKKKSDGGKINTTC